MIIAANNYLDFIARLERQVLYNECPVTRYFCFHSIILHFSPRFFLYINNPEMEGQQVSSESRVSLIQQVTVLVRISFNSSVSDNYPGPLRSGEARASTDLCLCEIVCQRTIFVVALPLLSPGLKGNALFFLKNIDLVFMTHE